MAKKHNAPANPAQEQNEALFQAVRLCRKAGALPMGFDDTGLAGRHQPQTGGHLCRHRPQPRQTLL